MFFVESWCQWCQPSVMNLVATHSNCTSPMDYISQHALHSHITVHHYTHHTAVTIHSLVLIVSPHLHLIHSHTFKQHSHMHSLRSLVLPWLTFPSGFPSLSICVLPGLLTLSPDRLLPASLTPPAYWWSSLSAACPDPLLCLWLWLCLVYIALDTTAWYLPVWPLRINKAASGSTHASDQSFVTEDFATQGSSTFQVNISQVWIQEYCLPLSKAHDHWRTILGSF